MSKAEVSWLDLKPSEQVGVIRGGPNFETYGDPYVFACTVQSQSTGFVASASASSTVCTLTLNPVFSADPTCTVSRNTTGSAIIGTVSVNSSTSVAVALWNTSGAIQTGAFNLICIGPR